MFIINGMNGSNTAGAGMVLAPWDRRERTTQEILENEIQPFMSKIPGLDVFAIVPPSLPSPGGGGAPIEFVIGTTQPYAVLDEVADEVLSQARESGRFIFVDSDLRIDRPRQTVQIDREKAALMGVSRSGQHDRGWLRRALLVGKPLLPGDSSG